MDTARLLPHIVGRHCTLVRYSAVTRAVVKYIETARQISSATKHVRVSFYSSKLKQAFQEMWSAFHSTDWAPVDATEKSKYKFDFLYPKIMVKFVY